ncbi:MAG: ABC transporter substrate-binding protein [Bacilli bacterium]|nr:ABC transporter substrate-binding protein [Bacilli bacterium]
MKNTLKTFAASVLAFSSVALLAACGGKNYAANNKAIMIGNSGPLTGPYAIYGTGVKNAIEMAVEEINAKQTDGFKFSYTGKDDQGDGEIAAQNFNTLYESGMQVSLGCVTSGACVGFAGADENNEVFKLTPSATADAVYKAGVYQMCFSDSGQGTAAAKYVKEYYKGKKVGVLYNSAQDYSKGIYQNFAKEFGEANITATATFTDDATASFDGQVTTLKDCDVVFLPIYYTPATTFIRAAFGKIADNAVYFGADGLDGIDGVEGFDVNSFPQKISMLSHFNAASTATATSTFVSAYNSKYDPKSLNQFAASAYDCVYAIYGMMKNYESKGNSIANNIAAKDLNAILTEEIKTYTFDGVTGTGVKWNADNTVDKTPLEFEINPNRVHS